MKVFSRSFGKGQVLLIFHGVLGNSDQWVTVAKQLAKTHHVVVPDLPNHGQSEFTQAFDLKNTSNYLADWILQNKWENIILLGHSWGGKIAMQMANDFPQLFERLIIVDVAPKQYDLNSTHLQWMNAIEKLQMQTFSSFSQLSAFLTTLFNNDSDRQLFLKNFKLENKTLIWKSNALEIARHFNYFLQAPLFERKIQIPTLFLKGEQSNYIQEEDINLIASYFTNYQLQEIKTAVHSPHLENTQQFLQEVLYFLAH